VASSRGHSGSFRQVLSSQYLKLPFAVRSEPPSASHHLEVPIFNSVLSIVRVQQVRPRNDHEDDKGLRLELEGGVVVNLNRSQGGVARLCNQLRSY